MHTVIFRDHSTPFIWCIGFRRSSFIVNYRTEVLLLYSTQVLEAVSFFRLARKKYTFYQVPRLVHMAGISHTCKQSISLKEFRVFSRQQLRTKCAVFSAQIDEKLPWIIMDYGFFPRSFSIIPLVPDSYNSYSCVESNFFKLLMGQGWVRSLSRQPFCQFV